MSPRSPLVGRGLRALAVASVAALALTSGTTQALAQTDGGYKIDTYTSCVGVCGSLGPFGNPDTATYGQTLTAPDGVKKFKNVTWYQNAGPGTLVFRAELYTWDGAKAGTLVAESKAKTVKFTDPSQTIGTKFKFKKAKIKSGTQYVVFATVSKDYEQTQQGFTTSWPVHDTDVFAGGQTVWLNDTGDESQWTTQTWSGISYYDMAFKATMK